METVIEDQSIKGRLIQAGKALFADKGYIDEKIETVDLENMQGVEGLKAFRVEVLSDK